MKSKTSKLMIGIIFLAGLSLLLYPFVANQWNNYRQKQLISSYEQTVSQKETSNGIDYNAELKKAEAYNEALLPSILPDSFAVAAASDKEDQSYMDALNIAGDEMMGIVEIPKIDIKLPIYHTTEEDVLKQPDIWKEALFQSAVKVHTPLSPHTADFRVRLFLPIWISWKKAIIF